MTEGYQHAKISGWFIRITFPIFFLGLVSTLSETLTLHSYLFLTSKSFLYSFIAQVSNSTIFSSILSFYLFDEFRTVERMLGSKKYGSLLLLSLITSTFATPITIVLLHKYFNIISLSISPIPISLLASALTFYTLIVPKVQKVNISKTTFIYKKIFAYAGMIALLLYTGKNAILPTIYGTLIAYLVYNDTIQLHKIYLPSFMKNALFYLFTIITDPHDTKIPQQTSSANRDTITSISSPTNISPTIHHRNLARPGPNDPLTHMHLDTLVSLGFSRQRAQIALHQANNDLNQAIELLT